MKRNGFLLLALAVLLYVPRTLPGADKKEAASQAPAAKLSDAEQEQFLKPAKITTTHAAKKGVTNTTRVTMTDGVMRHGAVRHGDARGIRDPLFRGVRRGDFGRFEELFLLRIAQFGSGSLGCGLFLIRAGEGAGYVQKNRKGEQKESVTLHFRLRYVNSDMVTL